MPEPILYLLLSLGSGAVYALLANGVVAIYKGSGVLNFAQGGIAMMGAYCYLALVNAGVSKYFAAIIVMLGAAAFGAAIAIGIFRPLRAAPALAKVVATLGLLIFLQGFAYVVWGPNEMVVPSVLPIKGINIDGSSIGENRLWMTGIAVAIAALLWGGYRFTRLGLATQATSQNERGAAYLGFSPTAISSLNWAVGSALAAIAGILITPITSLDQGSLPLLVLPALAAALVGRFSSFGVTTVSAFVIGWIETWVFFKWKLQGAQTAAPFVIVILIMVVAGRALPSRGAVSEGRPPSAPAGRARWTPLTLCVAAGFAIALFLNTTYQLALVTTLITVVFALSLVVLTGFVGQISLMQMTFAGLGGLFTAKLAANIGIPFPLSILAAALLVAPIGVVLGLPALRTRGLSLAIVTLGASIAIDAVLFQNQGWTNASEGLAVPTAHLGSFSLDPLEHPGRYAVVVLIALVLVVLLVGNIRRSGTGRRMLAVRSNERAAAVAGVNVAAVKLQAFALSAAIAGFGGGLLAYSNPFIVLGNGAFAAMPSISLLAVAYIGGIGSIGGAAVAGVGIAGGLLFVLLGHISGFVTYYTLISGVALIWTLLAQPDGVAPFFSQTIVPTIKRRVARHSRQSADAAEVPPPNVNAAPDPVRPNV